MAERVMATTGATFDLTRLRAETRPDPLGEAVDPTTDGVFQLSFMLPYIRLIRQDTRGISPWRRSVLGSWRSSRLSADDDVINESVHDSAFQRLGKKVRLRRGDVVTPTVYKPRALLRAAPRDKK
jgi:hypothetical protein